MKHFDRLLIIVPVLFLFAVIVANMMLVKNNTGGKQYIVDANRIEQQILSGEVPSVEQFPSILSVSVYDGDSSFYNYDGEYLIREINGKIYRFCYKKDHDTEIKKTALSLSAVLLILLAVIMAVLIYIRQNILRQFAKLGDVPIQLAKGNLSEPLKENKNRFFGKFIWGLDILRGELEQSKTNELERVRKEKTLLLSLSHDIKTPLAAIKLYSKALSKGLYTEDNKRIEAAESINSKADEIEGYLTEIINSLNNDFMSFEISISDFYLSSVISRIEVYYNDKLSITGTNFSVEKYNDCMLSGDPDRLEEVMQNIMENAIKYGNGKNISISFSDEEDCRLITVSNSGSELSEQELDHIFESFWRGSNTHNKQGSGLGLYICSRLMNEMGGDIFADCSDGIMSVTLVCRKCS